MIPRYRHFFLFLLVCLLLPVTVVTAQDLSRSIAKLQDDMKKLERSVQQLNDWLQRLERRQSSATDDRALAQLEARVARLEKILEQQGKTATSAGSATERRLQALEQSTQRLQQDTYRTSPEFYPRIQKRTIEERLQVLENKVGR